MQHDVFISYTQPDRNVAMLLHDTLQQNALASWIAVSESNGIATGTDFESQVVKAIGNSKVFVLVYSLYCNKSGDVLQEVRNRYKQQPTIIVRLDRSAYCDALSYHLKDVQYIDATPYSSYEVANRLVLDVRKAIAGNSGPAGGIATDKLLLEKGIKLVKQKKYHEAIPVLQQHLSIAPDSMETRFYLSLALIEGKKTRKLDGILVRKIESILLPAVTDNKDAGYINMLLAILKQGYYWGNGFSIPGMGIGQLIRGVTISPEKINELVTHLYEPENQAWQYLQQHK